MLHPILILLKASTPGPFGIKAIILSSWGFNWNFKNTIPSFYFYRKVTLLQAYYYTFGKVMKP